MNAAPVIQTPELDSLTIKIDKWHTRLRAVLIASALIAVAFEVMTRPAVEWSVGGTMILALVAIVIGRLTQRRAFQDRSPSVSVFFYHLGECLVLGVLMLVFHSFAGIGYALLLLITLRAGLRYGKRMLMTGMVVGFLVLALVFAHYSATQTVDPWFASGLVLAFLVIPLYMALLFSALAMSRDVAKRADEAKSRFLANVSHEFRTPLNSILGMSDLLSSFQLNSEANGYVQGIRSSAVSLGNTVQEMLDLATIEAGKVRVIPSVFSPREVLDDVLRQFKLGAQEKGLDLRHRAGAGVPDYVVGDADHTRSVLANLIGNSLKFTDRGWIQVHLSARARGEDKSLLCYRVTDSGCGFSADIGEALFNPFTQADNSLSRKSSGSGLGLAIAKGYVDANNGDIGFKSTPGGGSEFWFTFEVQPADHEQISIYTELRATQHQPVGKAKKALNILIVDDQESNRVVFEAMLRKAGHDVRSAASGDQGITEMEADWPDIALIDLHMPGINGLDVLRWIRGHEAERQIPTTPVLVLTADGTASSRSNVLNAGATGVLTKPLSMGDLLRHVSSVVTHETLNSTDSATLFSDSNLSELRETLGDAHFKDYIIAARSDVQMALEGLSRALAAEDVSAAAHELHTLKGLTSGLGMRATASVCSQFEACIIARQAIIESDVSRKAGLQSGIEKAMQEMDKKLGF